MGAMRDQNQNLGDALINQSSSHKLAKSSGADAWGKLNCGSPLLDSEAHLV
jgi:hypothetical protein